MATNDLLKKFGIELSSLNSVSGMKKENIYKKDIFADCFTDKEKKTMRRKLRNLLDNFVSSILRCKDTTQLKKLCVEFNKFYLGFYNVNDYSLLSICSNNTDEVKKENLQKMLDIVKANILEKSEFKKKTTKTKTETKTENNEVKEVKEVIK